MPLIGYRESLENGWCIPVAEEDVTDASHKNDCKRLDEGEAKVLGSHNIPVGHYWEGASYQKFADNTNEGDNTERPVQNEPNLQEECTAKHS